ncbi:MAG: hypothetical protein GAK35_02632 [Herbaspirillum frisingense]|uniref:Uncharacterized protein n=1 Tax=Herbaspirillum frisingense TaxID=92645 RepID=A0A7V8FVP8_9BURK|nr:MAG: hypothetical protein GAK35_02632 [Herbaspirillum frisingense]
MKTLFDQTTQDERYMIALLIGADSNGAHFKNMLREIPSLPGSFTIGEAAKAYCKQIVKFLEKETTA